MEEVGPNFERETGHRLAMEFASLGGVLKRAEDGAPVDVLLAPRQGMERLVEGGRVARDAVTAIARSRLGLAVRKGAPKPDISSHGALRRALLGARAITYSHPSWGGVSGSTFLNALDWLGIADKVKAKTVFAQSPGGDGLGALLGSGEAEIAVHQIQEFLRIPSIEIVGPLPDDLQNPIEFTAAVTVGAPFPEAARLLVAFLLTPDAAAVIRVKGMEPAQADGSGKNRAIGVQ